MTEAAARVIGFDRPAGRSGPVGGDVVVGIIDAGFDGTHPGVLAVAHRAWDQTVDGKRNVNGVTGREWLGAPLAGLTDEEGHGTHLSGIVSAFSPTSKQVLVKSTLAESAVVAGVQYVFDRADELSCPAVVNLSLGLDHSDGHDGTDAFSEAIDSFVAPGRVVCCAVGNDGAVPGQHMSASIGPGDTMGVFVVLAASSSGAPGGRAAPWRRVSVWLDGEVGDVTVSLETQNTKVVLDTADDEPVTGFLGPFHVELSAGIDPQNGAARVSVLARPGVGEAQLKEAVLLLRITGSGLASEHRLDGWVSPEGACFAALASGQHIPGIEVQAQVDRGYLVWRPASARSTVAVGASASRATWTTLAGDLPDPNLAPNVPGDPFEVGEHLWFSSAGPTRDGRERPDILAPGAPIFSWRSDQKQFTDLELSPAGDVIMLGSSQATAIVSALTANLLRAEPNLSVAQVRQRLIASAARTAYDPAAGFGMIDAGRL